MSSYFGLSPVLSTGPFFDPDGVLLAGGKLFTYQAGSSSLPLVTYSDANGTVENTNPIVLDSSGFLPVQIFLDLAQPYHLVLTKEDGTTVIESQDDVWGVSPPQLSTNVAAVWVDTEPATFKTSTSFTVRGNFTSFFQPHLQLKWTPNGYGEVVTSAYTAGSAPTGDFTTVTMLIHSGTYTTGSSGMQYSIVDPVNTPVYRSYFADVATNAVSANASDGVYSDGNPTHSIITITQTPATGLPKYFLGSNDGLQIKPYSNSQVGKVETYYTKNVPSGTLELAGQVVNRTDYPDLWAFVQANTDLVDDAIWIAGATASFSAGNGSTTFRLPDFRGEFVRSWDHGRGLDVGRSLGTVQADQLRAHNHSVRTNGQGGSGSLTGNIRDSYNSVGPGVGYTDYAGGSSNNAENRPRNVTLMYVIRYQ